MRDVGKTRRRQVVYGAAAVIVIAAAGLLALDDRADPSTASAPQQQAAPNATRSQATSPQVTPGDEIVVVNGLKRDEAVALVGAARRQAAAGNYAAAKATLARADKAAPGLAETAVARDELARLETPEGQLARHLERARLAVDHDDRATAEAELSEAARLKPDAPQIAALRASLKAAQDEAAQREARIADALARMRAAIARRDFAAANSALNEAERIDMEEPAIRRARRELALARGEAPQ